MEAIGEDGTVCLDGRRTLSSALQGYTYFRDGDVLIAKITPCFENGKGACVSGLLNGVGFGTTELIVVRVTPDKLNNAFLHWLFTSPDFRTAATATMFGAGGQKRVPDDFVRGYRIALPPLPEQKAIAAFLDRETAKIDALVSEQEHLLVLLEEKRQAVIANAVTKGLDPTVPMKDSGVEWLGQVPAHWSVVRLAYYASIENGSTPNRNDLRYWDEGDIPWVGSGEVNQYIVNEPSEYVTALALDECSLRVVPKGAVLVGLVGQGRTRAMSALLGINAAINQNVAAVIAGERLMPAFLHYSLQAAYEHLRECARGGNQAALNCEIISAFRIAIPPIQEQELIAAHLDAARDGGTP